MNKVIRYTIQYTKSYDYPRIQNKYDHHI